MNNLLNNITDDVALLGHTVRRLFWEIVDETQQTRSRIRLRRELASLAERETSQYERLGQMGVELLQDGIAVARTLETSLILAEIDRLQGEQRRLMDPPEAKFQETAAPFPWHRIERALHTGEWVIHVKSLSDSSPWCGRPMTGEPAVGLCLAVKRGDSIQAVTPDTVCLGGDLLMILSPASYVSDWDRWMQQGPVMQAGEGS